MADQDVHAATTLTEMMRRRAALTPDKPYFHLYGETITYGRLWAASARYAAGLARADLRAGDKLCLIYPTCAEFFYTFFGALRMGAVPVPLYPTLSVEATARIFNDSEAVAVATIGWFRKGVRVGRAGAPGPHRPRATRPRGRRARARGRRAGRRGSRVPPVHVGEHGAPAWRHAHPPERRRDHQVHGRGRRAHGRGSRRLVAAALSRHGAHRLRLHAAPHGHAALAPAPGPPQPAPVARADHRGARHVHGLARLRLPKLRAPRPRYHRARPHEPQGGALRRRDGAPVHHRRLRVALRPRAHHLALLWPRRGDARRSDLAARGAAQIRSERPVPLGRPALPRRLGEDRRARRRFRSPAGAGRGGRDLGAEPGCHDRLLQQPGGHPDGAAAGRDR